MASTRRPTNGSLVGVQQERGAPCISTRSCLRDAASPHGRRSQTRWRALNCPERGSCQRTGCQSPRVSVLKGASQTGIVGRGLTTCSYRFPAAEGREGGLQLACEFRGQTEGNTMASSDPQPLSSSLASCISSVS